MADKKPRAKSFNPDGRPTKATPDAQKKAIWYVNGGWMDEGDAIPSIEGLACVIKVHRKTLHEWKNDPKSPFRDILDSLMDCQGRVLQNNGLKGSFNAAITKLILSKHGYSDRAEVDHQSSDGSMTPVREVVNRVVFPDPREEK